MAFNIKIDLENCYQIEKVSNDLSSCVFTTILKDGSPANLAVQVCGEHDLLPNVLNLAFGPLNEDGSINDSIKLHHRDHSKAFSTIVSAGMRYLKENAAKYLGFDGSNHARAYLYYRCVQNNFDYLTQHFEIYGVNYYARMLRKIRDDDFESFDMQNMIAFPQAISPTEQIPHEKLYNYIIFRMRNK
ncbi:MAG TPA: hypothetical protein VGE79_14770 [Niastella sp.]